MHLLMITHRKMYLQTGKLKVQNSAKSLKIPHGRENFIFDKFQLLF